MLKQFTTKDKEKQNLMVTDACLTIMNEIISFARRLLLPHYLKIIDMGFYPHWNIIGKCFSK